MIINEFYRTREDGVNLYRTYSDEGYMVEQIETGVRYSDAIDVEDAPYTYKETDTPVPKLPEEDEVLTQHETANI